MELIVLDYIQWKCPEFDAQCASTMSTGTALCLVTQCIGGPGSVSPAGSCIPAGALVGGAYHCAIAGLS